MKNNKKILFDYIFIGSSPISIFEAIRYRSKGYSVLIVDLEEKIGGSWRTIDLGDFKEVDIGPHTIILKEKILKRLNELNFDLVKEPDQDLIFVENPFNFPLWFQEKYSLLAGSLNSIQKCSKYLWIKVLLKSFFITIFKLKKNKGYISCFPQSGMGDFLKTIFEYAKKNKCKFLLNTKIKEINFDRKKQKVEVKTNSSIYFCKHIVFTSYSDVKTIKVDKKIFRQKNFIHEESFQLQIICKDSKKFRKGGTYRFPKNKYVIRSVKDLTYYLQESNDKVLNKDTRVLVIWLNNYNGNLKNFKKKIVKILIDTGILSEKCKIVENNISIIKRKRRIKRDWSVLTSDVNELFQFKDTWSLSTYLNDNLNNFKHE